MNKPLPPYGREVSRILKTPHELQTYSGCNADQATVWIATGPHAWDWAEDHPRHIVLVLPEGTDPHTLRWGFLAGHEPILLLPPASEDMATRREVAHAILHDGVGAVLALGEHSALMRSRTYIPMEERPPAELGTAA